MPIAIGAALAGLGLAGSASAAAPPPGTLTFYSSLPLHGVSRVQTTAMVNGMRLALEQSGGRAGAYAIRFRSLDDSTRATGDWDPGAAAVNARTAIEDPTAVYYIGEYNSGASAVSIPILNEGGLAQVSPSNTYVGLTTGGPGASPGEPRKYYPTGRRTYMRIAPRDTVQAAALVEAMRADRCRRVAVTSDRGGYALSLTPLLREQAWRLHVRFVSRASVPGSRRAVARYVARLRRLHVDCYVLSGIASTGTVRVTNAVARAFPHVRLYGPDGVCYWRFTDPTRGGISRAAGRRFKCTVSTMPLSAYPGGAQFADAYAARFGTSTPDPYAIFGYEAMRLGLDTVAGLGVQGASRAAVVRALLATHNRNSVLGTYGFDRNGDTTLRTYGLYDVVHGLPAFLRAVHA
jgi:branched-chain amino acid transport system substrate-binding protein